MVTIKQASEILEVTPQAIYKRFNDPSCDAELLNELKTNDKGQKFVTDNGLKLLKTIFNKTTDNKPTTNDNNELVETLRNSLKTSTEQINRLYDEIRELKDEYREIIKRKDEQIERLQQMNENSQSIMFAMQQAQSKRKLLDFFKKPREDERG